MTVNSVNLTEMGERIRQLRQQQGKTQKYFADLLYISPSYLTLIEKGQRTLTLDVLVQIAKICDVSTDYLLFGEVPKRTDRNFRTFQRLSENYPSEKLAKALRLAEFSLLLNEECESNTDS